MKYLSADSWLRGFARSIPASAYSAIDMISRATNIDTSSRLETSPSMPTTEKSRSA